MTLRVLLGQRPPPDKAYSGSIEGKPTCRGHGCVLAGNRGCAYKAVRRTMHG